MHFNLPTYLTLLRIVLIPILAVLFYVPWSAAHVVCGIIFAFAAATDWLDGYLARRMGLATRFGAFLDPVADKLMVAVALVLIVQAEPQPLIAVASAIIIGREITIASLREWMAEIGQRKRVEVSSLGKWKTTFQMLAITLLLLGLDARHSAVKTTGELLLVVSAVLTLWSMVVYLQAAMPVFKASTEAE
ncbi:CDP-diacylglycerol--glycerol-3-phosphate 3-phosphatidyltransferase [Methylococcus sp. ANG]|uniref:CDP-diacylglycerol--glycerol-3-phosphate 3-phosphatidyltransferase n=1 Tax=unclassified Methylococcus TaxID=2618889 RepID=UPI001C531F5F|nr:CDP-diacylglycerol--glycerol-3-phosphate 3-phosphatidyltransferase [Methylococcus sp. Mc7]QXP83879.1 CDP-diacylglycerol--glycerol-3-phosphate 3-phosphatidyltransferase [Methylococcus sp. Mc7]